jgi:RNA polymerase sigma factor (sigma-70 family)
VTDVLDNVVGKPADVSPHSPETTDSPWHGAFTPARRPAGPADGTPIAIGFGAPLEQLPTEPHALISQYRSLVERIVGRLNLSSFPGAIDRDDLRQEGYLALLTAASTYLPDRGSFTGYAQTVVTNALLTAMRRADPLPETVRRDMRTIREAREERQSEGESPASGERLADLTGLTPKRIAQVNRWVAEAGMALKAAPAVDDDLTAMAALSDPDASTPEELTIRACEVGQLRAALSTLDERERRIVLARIVHGTTVRDVAADEQLSPARVCQIQARAVRSLRRAME